VLLSAAARAGHRIHGEFRPERVFVGSVADRRAAIRETAAVAGGAAVRIAGVQAAAWRAGADRASLGRVVAGVRGGGRYGGAAGDRERRGAGLAGLAGVGG